MPDDADESPDVLHLIVLHDPVYGPSLTSPQVPGLAFGRPTDVEFNRDIRGALEFAGIDPARVRVHDEWPLVTPEGQECIIRVAQSPEPAERKVVADRLKAILETEERHDFLADGIANEVGERVFVCCVASDPLGFVTAQMDERGDGLSLVCAVAEQLVWRLQIAANSKGKYPTWRSIADRGWDLDITVGELMSQLGSESSERVLVSA